MKNKLKIYIFIKVMSCRFSSLNLQCIKHYKLMMNKLTSILAIAFTVVVMACGGQTTTETATTETATTETVVTESTTVADTTKVASDTTGTVKQ